MIYGIGTDIVQVSRIAQVLERTHERFAEKILGTEELIEYHQRHEKIAARGIQYLCNRYAAKEAFSKAIGLGMRVPFNWHGLQVLNDQNGAPYVAANGQLLAYMEHHQLTARVSLSDEVDYSIAFVIIEKN